jgi:DNA-binding transcriptional ArsR family regulator
LEVSLAERGPDLVDPRLLKALAHPIRTDILSVLQEGPSSPSRIERRLESVSINLISHHMKVLKDLGCIELAETVTRRGATEHVYRVVGPFVLGDEEWAKLTRKARQPLTAAILRSISGDLAASIGAGRFDELPDSHLSRTPMNLDREGWAEVRDILARALEEVIEAGERSEGRDEPVMPVTVAIMQFPKAEAKA